MDRAAAHVSGICMGTQTETKNILHRTDSDNQSMLNHAGCHPLLSRLQRGDCHSCSGLAATAGPYPPTPALHGASEASEDPDEARLEEGPPPASIGVTMLCDAHVSLQLSLARLCRCSCRWRVLWYLPCRSNVVARIRTLVLHTNGVSLHSDVGDLRSVVEIRMVMTYTA